MAEDVRKRLSKAREYREALQGKKKEKEEEDEKPLLDVPQGRAGFWWFTLLILGVVMIGVGLVTVIDLAAVRFKLNAALISIGCATVLIGLICVSVYFHRWGKL